MPRLRPRQEPPTAPPPEPVLVDGLIVDGRDVTRDWRAYVRALNERRQRAEGRQLAELYGAEVLTDGRRLWSFGPDEGAAVGDGDDAQTAHDEWRSLSK